MKKKSIIIPIIILIILIILTIFYVVSKNNIVSKNINELTTINNDLGNIDITSNIYKLSGDIPVSYSLNMAHGQKNMFNEDYIYEIYLSNKEIYTKISLDDKVATNTYNNESILNLLTLLSTKIDLNTYNKLYTINKIKYTKDDITITYQSKEYLIEYKDIKITLTDISDTSYNATLTLNNIDYNITRTTDSTTTKYYIKYNDVNINIFKTDNTIKLSIINNLSGTTTYNLEKVTSYDKEETMSNEKYNIYQFIKQYM